MACVSSQLDAMPERPVSPSQTVMEEVQKLTTMATKYTTGDDDAFRAKFKSHMRSYAKALQAARPKLRLGTPGYEKQVIPLDSDEDVASDTPTPSKKRKNNGGYATSPAPRAGVPRPTPRSTPRPTRFKQEEQPATQARAELTLDKIHKAIDRASTSDLPDQVHPKVTERLILDSTSMWPALTTDLLDNIQSLVGKMLAKCVADTLGARGCTQLFTETGRIIDAFCKNVFEDETRFINHLVAGETHRPTSYGDALKQSTQRMKTELAAARLKERLDEHFDTLEVEHNAKVTLPEKRMEKAKDSDFVAKHLGPDKYAREVAAMGMPFAYYDLASSRMVDTVASFLERGVVYTVETKLQARLHMDLRARDDAHCAELLAEDPEREIQRQRLIAEKARLEEALKELEGLPGQH